MATADLLLAVTLGSAPLLQWSLERLYYTSRYRRIWWVLHYQETASAYIQRMTAERDFEAERAEFERFRQNCRALVARWECNQYRKAA